MRHRTENLLVAVILAAGAVGVGWTALSPRRATPWPRRPAEHGPAPTAPASSAIEAPACPEGDWTCEDPADEDLLQRESAQAACQPAGRGSLTARPRTRAPAPANGRDGPLGAIDSIILII